MRLVNEQFETIDRNSIDLSKGTLVPVKTIKENATPIDNVEKFAWYDEDWEDAEMFIPLETVQPQATQLDIIESQVTYTAMKTNTLIPRIRGGI